MKKILIILLALTLMLVILGGNDYLRNQTELQQETSLKVALAQEKEEEKLVQELQEKKLNSVVDWLKFKSIEDQNIIISVFGSDVTAGTGASNWSNNWSNQFVHYLRTQENISNVSLVNNGYVGYSTERLIKEDKIEEVINIQPDLIIIEVPAINNFNQKVSLRQTSKDILYFVEVLKEQLPDSLIVLQSSNPIIYEYTFGNRYEDFIGITEEIAEENDLNYINIFEGFETKLKSKNIKLKDILFDEVHPNDLGHEIWSDILIDYASSVKINE